MNEAQNIVPNGDTFKLYDLEISFSLQPHRNHCLPQVSSAASIVPVTTNRALATGEWQPFNTLLAIFMPYLLHPSPF